MVSGPCAAKVKPNRGVQQADSGAEHSGPPPDGVRDLDAVRAPPPLSSHREAKFRATCPSTFGSYPLETRRVSVGASCRVQGSARDTRTCGDKAKPSPPAVTRDTRSDPDGQSAGMPRTKTVR